MLSDPCEPGANPGWPDDGDEDWAQLESLTLAAHGLEAGAWRVAAVVDADVSDASRLDFNAVGAGREWRLNVRAVGPQGAEMMLGIEAFWYPAKARWEV